MYVSLCNGSSKRWHCSFNTTFTLFPKISIREFPQILCPTPTLVHYHVWVVSSSLEDLLCCWAEKTTYNISCCVCSRRSSPHLMVILSAQHCEGHTSTNARSSSLMSWTTSHGNKSEVHNVQFVRFSILNTLITILAIISPLLCHWDYKQFWQPWWYAGKPTCSAKGTIYHSRVLVIATSTRMTDE